MSHEQEIFDRVATHLLTQGTRAYRPSVNPDTEADCAYRSEEGLMCAVGCLIDDEVYSTDLEGESVSSEVVHMALLASDIPVNSGHVATLLTDLQLVHDCFPPSEWEERLRRLAKEYGLTFAEQS